VESGDLWKALCDTIQEQRPLLANWMHMGTQLEHRPGLLKVGFPVSEAHACESLKRDDKRKFLEGLLADLSGAPTRLDLVIEASLVAKELPEPTFGFDGLPTSSVAISAPPPPTSCETLPEKAPPVPMVSSAEFYDDPLINATIEAFKAKILPSESAG
jgi:DNA polymerase-3 subunit gamma/tau